MKTNGTRSAFVCIVIITLVCLIIHPSAYAAFFYKSYIIRYDRGWNILCDPYVVKKDDWVFKLFRQKGEISNRDFPEFLRIFKRLNPHIQDIDRIRPGQHILIPLKKVDQDELPEASLGVVTIPYVTNAIMPETESENSTNYRVKSGDCVSVLISKRYGNYGTPSYKEGEALFRMMNPEIKNLNLIYAGQMIRMPDPKIQNQKPSQLQASLDKAGIHESPENMDRSRPMTTDKKLPLSDVEDIGKEPSESPLSKVALILDGKLFNKGNYYLPRPGLEDFKIDLSKTPFIKLEDGTRVFFTTGDENMDPEMEMIKSFWKDVRIVNITREDSMEKVFDTVFSTLESDVVKHRLSFSEDGVEFEVKAKWIIEKPREKGEAIRHLCITVIHDLKEQTPQSIVRYLDQHNIIVKDILIGSHIKEPKSNVSRFNIPTESEDIIDAFNHETLVGKLLVALGYQYVPNKNISFQYAGVQINATSNLATNNNGSAFYVDYGSFYGDAMQAIEKSGYSIIQVNNNDGLDDIIQKLLGVMKTSFVKNPTILAAKRPAVHNTRLTIQGFLMNHTGGSKTLLTQAPLQQRILRFLKDIDIRIIRINMQGEKNEKI